MGAWGTSLYANDSTSDIRGEYLDKLRRGKTNEEITNELVEANTNIGDAEEESLFWFALADTQWNYGRLLPEVKEKALFYLSQDKEWERWKESGQKKLLAWKKTLEMLKRKLESPQPPIKKVTKYRLYQCKWNLGDVFAYRFTSNYSKEKGFEGKYVIFRKVSEDTWWPGHIIPVVQIYNWFGENLPPMRELTNLDLLPVCYSPSAFRKNPNKPLEYNIKVISESERAIPSENLIFMGNLSGNDIILFRGHDYWTGYPEVGWESSKYNVKFEHYVIDAFLAWRDILSHISATKGRGSPSVT